MYCPRLDHFVRLNVDGTVGRCGHMINAKRFKSFDELEKNEWTASLKNSMTKDIWPNECKRCQQSELVKGERILTGQADISGQPSGQSMRWKLALANNQVKIHGVALQWS